MIRHARRKEEADGDRPENLRARGVAAALALATALLAWPVVPVAGAPAEGGPVLAKGAKKTKAKSRPGWPPHRVWAEQAAGPEPSAVEVAISTAREQLGKPYRWAGSGPNNFDCSGLVRFAYSNAGVVLPRDSRSQYGHVERIPIEDLEPGDLVFSGGRRVSHVGLYIGDGQMIHSPQSGRRVEVAPLRRNLIGAGRPVA